jgi:restriction system protein
MAQKKTFSGIASDVARAYARADRERQQQEKAKLRELELQRRESARQQAQLLKEEKQQYLVSRQSETEEENLDLQNRNKDLEIILYIALATQNKILFSELQPKIKFRQFRLPTDLETIIEEPSLEAFRAKVPKLSGIRRMIPGATQKYEDELNRVEEEFEQAVIATTLRKEQREQAIRKLTSEYELEKQQFAQDLEVRIKEVTDFEEAYFDGNPDAVVTYNSMVLERSEYPEGFPQEFRTAYLPESKEIVIEYELPGVSIVPVVSQYTYVKTSDEIRQKNRSSSDIKNAYQDVVAAICLRTIYEIFDADQGGHIEVVVFNGFVQTIDPATGKDIRPHLISVRTTKERFGEINLSRVDKKVCLRNFGAQVSPRPAEMQAVKPVVDFDMVDKRFIEKSDILADIESRPNLMDLNPYEFENFISNLFDQIGFESKLTRSAKDGGVDVIAFDPRPIIGGKIVIQAKRYKNVVGVSAVRDLYGTMINEGASKGVLVTTSHYGPDAYNFSKDKPIELIDGGGLLYLLQQQGIEARIVFPED